MANHIPLPAARIGPSLNRWRRLNRVKQAALAADMHVSQATVSRWEAGTLCPGEKEMKTLVGLLSARPTSSADRALLDLVVTSSKPVHLVCDLTHRLLAASPARAAEWRDGAARLMHTSLWRFASRGIVEGEADLADKGWYEPFASDVVVETERAQFPEVTIEAGEIVWARIPLSDGSFARLVWDGARGGHA
jgi:transcriptional regulator with XRE-family HTH domain